ncbi:NAD-dependent protein deacylase sirtuin-5, mitochondrial-like [Oopsacas minuta]|uniref:NAD-dependent protein deacylase n=1 Tax=Oopsacas minuta TaxID=111878 RepID=A0AAV7K1J2_9METZ|nr:NAD-dependent protein deacylase sirtuin-5, mitochondrial-like [Oopsacas minuta]
MADRGLPDIFGFPVDAREEQKDMNGFRKVLAHAKSVVALTGAGVSAESGVPTFRGAGGYWRTYQAQQLATPEAFSEDPSLVWEFYHYRREVMLTKTYNPAHLALANLEKRLINEGKQFTLLTQNIDRLHQAAGSQNVVELHGSLFLTRCLSCSEVKENRDSPICASLKDKGAPDPDEKSAGIPADQLPRCSSCSGLLRPHVVWFGESLDTNVMSKSYSVMCECDLFLVIGTSSVVYPAAGFALNLANKGVLVAEFNIEPTTATSAFNYHFHGKCGEILPPALAPPTEEELSTKTEK